MRIQSNRKLIEALEHVIQERQDTSSRVVVDDELLQAIESTIHEFSPAPESPAEAARVSILISDLRGFTAILEQFGDQQVIDVLNFYFYTMTGIIEKHGGVVDKFIGDSILALFDASDAETAGITNVLSCAVEMQIAMDEVNEVSARQGLPNLYMGIGINTGEAVECVFGSDYYRERTVIGDHVNMASRIESYSLRGQVLLSESSYQLCRDMVDVGARREVYPKGKSRPVPIHELLAVNLPERLLLPQREIRHSPRVHIDTPLRFYLIKDGHTRPEVHEGRVLNISYGGLRIFTDWELTLETDVMLSVSQSLLGMNTREVYARVVHSEVIEGGYESGLEFTRIDEAALHTIRLYVDGQLFAWNN